MLWNIFRFFEDPKYELEMRVEKFFYVGRRHLHRVIESILHFPKFLKIFWDRGFSRFFQDRYKSEGSTVKYCGKFSDFSNFEYELEMRMENYF